VNVPTVKFFCPVDFTCNICGTRNTGVEDFGREVTNCAGCQSSVRIRSLVYAISQELFGVPLTLPDFPILKGLRGLGMTDTDSYAQFLRGRFDYRNTFYDREPRLDISSLNGAQEGTLDFLTSSEVFEHVRPPLEDSLRNAFRLLRPDGVLIFTMPWGPDSGPASSEHFPSLDDYGLAQLRSGPVLVNRTSAGQLQIFDNLIFHMGFTPALEMRRITAAELRRVFAVAGFTDLRFYTEDYPPFGIHQTETWSLPVAARKQPLRFDPNVRTELMQQFAELRGTLRKLSATVEQRTVWAQSLEEELRGERHRRAEVETDFAQRTEWAQKLEQELAQALAWGAELQKENEARTHWAQDLDRQLQERSKWALESDTAMQRLELDLGKLRATFWNRLGRLLRLVR
jgi:SAM-dependent methyltransferase